MDDARAMPGVLGIYTGADLTAGGIGLMPKGMSAKNRDGSDMKKPDQPVLTQDKVRYVGDPVAFVVAETAKQAKDAAEMVFLDIETLPAVTDATAGAAPGAPLVHDGVAGNVILDFQYGEPEKVAEAFAKAAHISRISPRNNRIVVASMEPRSALASIEDGRFVLRDRKSVV